MNVPDDLRYSTDHEWARVQGDRVRVGITDYAQDALGDVVFVDLPAEGTTVDSALSDAPETLNSDPYGDGWICEIAPSDPSSVDGLLDPSGYRQLTDS